jgi:hypothetical protein
LDGGVLLSLLHSLRLDADRDASAGECFAASFGFGDQLSLPGGNLPSPSAIATLSRILLGQNDRKDQRVHPCRLLCQPNPFGDSDLTSKEENKKNRCLHERSCEPSPHR